MLTTVETTNPVADEETPRAGACKQAVHGGVHRRLTGQSVNKGTSRSNRRLTHKGWRMGDIYRESVSSGWRGWVSRGW